MNEHINIGENKMITLKLEKYANGRLKEKIREHFGVEE